MRLRTKVSLKMLEAKIWIMRKYLDLRMIEPKPSPDNNLRN
jgi:hypothetical protein